MRTARAKSMMSSFSPSSQWGSGVKSNWGFVPHSFTTTFPPSSGATGTSGSGMFGMRSMESERATSTIRSSPSSRSISPPISLMRTFRALASSTFLSRNNSPTSFEPVLRSARSVSTSLRIWRRFSSNARASCHGASPALSFSMAAASAARFSRIHLMSSMRFLLHEKRKQKHPSPVQDEGCSWCHLSSQPGTRAPGYLVAR